MLSAQGFDRARTRRAAMKIEWVERMLMKWGEAVFNGSQGGGGSGSSYPAYQLVHIRSSGGCEPPVDLEVSRMESAMSYVKISQPKLYRVAYDVYVQGMSYQTCAGRERCHLDTVYARLSLLHKLVANRLSEKPATIATANEKILA
jgi:hypothetical protein